MLRVPGGGGCKRKSDGKGMVEVKNVGKEKEIKLQIQGLIVIIKLSILCQGLSFGCIDLSKKCDFVCHINSL